MNYQDQLSPWVIYRLLPNLQRLTVARFRNRNDAEAYLKVIKPMLPHIQFAIAFDVNPSSAKQPLDRVKDNLIETAINPTHF